jgi:hypothetical protein
MMPFPVAKSRLGVVEHVYYQATNDQATQVEGRFSRPLSTMEQPYRRKIVATEDWQPLETGWLNEAGMLFISNEEGKCPQVVPTEKQRADMGARIVELAFGTDFATTGDCWLILPGETFRGQPKDVKKLYYRCQRDTATCWVTIFPK